MPLAGDEVSYRICAIPPKFEKFQAIHVALINLVPAVHVKWESQSQMEDGEIQHSCDIKEPKFNGLFLIFLFRTRPSPLNFVILQLSEKKRQFCERHFGLRDCKY